MKILAEVASELFSMFVADARMTLATLLLVALVAGLTHETIISAGAGGALLIAGSLAIVIEAAAREARRRPKA